jgi:hypothetical protein
VHGLGTFDEEYLRAVDHEIEGLQLKVLPLDRIIASKGATNCPDRAVIPILEATLLAREQSTS